MGGLSGNLQKLHHGPAGPFGPFQSKIDRHIGRDTKKGEGTRIFTGQVLFGGADPPQVKKPRLTKIEAANEQAEERARVARIRAQSGFGEGKAILRGPAVGGATAKIGG